MCIRDSLDMARQSGWVECRDDPVGEVSYQLTAVGENVEPVLDGRLGQVHDLSLIHI